MAVITKEVDAMKLMRSFVIEVKIKRQREAIVRTWIGMRLIEFASWIMNCSVEIEEFEDIMPDGNHEVQCV